MTSYCTTGSTSGAPSLWASRPTPQGVFISGAVSTWRRARGPRSPVLHDERDVRGQVVQQHAVGKHHGLDALTPKQPQAGVEVGVVAVEHALDALDA